jgi:hypothetical protein
VRALLSWTHEGDLGRDLQQAAEVSADETIGKMPAKEDVPLEQPGTRICRDVFQLAARQNTSCSNFFPANRLKADARTRTGDPFITS